MPTNTLVGLLAGLGLGLALALMREQLDNSLKTPEDVETKLGVTFLGLLPEVEDEQRKGPRRKRSRRLKPRVLSPELIVHEQPTSGVAEAARALRTNLMFMNPDAPYRKILVTSSSPSRANCGWAFAA